MVLHASMPGVPIKVVPLDARRPEPDRARGQPLRRATIVPWRACGSRSSPTSTATSTALPAVARDAEQLVVLGDLLDYVDYHDPCRRHPRSGLRRAPGPAVHRAAQRRATSRGCGSSTAASGTRTPDPLGTLTDVVADALPRGAGGGRSGRAAHPRQRRRGGDLERGGRRRRCPTWTGAVSRVAAAGWVSSPAGRARPGHARYGRRDRCWQPLIRSADDFAAAVRAGSARSTCCARTSRPASRVLRYDVVPGRLEMYGPGLLEAIDEHRPGLVGVRARAPADQPRGPAAAAPNASTSVTSSASRAVRDRPR